jgi:hypothetical protein
MKIVLVFGTVTLLSFIIAGCNNSSESTGVSIVGVWDCQTNSEGSPSNLNLSDTKTFSADGQYSSSKFPEGKKYKYRLDGDKLITSLPYGDWIEKVTSLTNDSLEYYNDKSGKPVKVSCQKKS